MPRTAHYRIKYYIFKKKRQETVKLYHKMNIIIYPAQPAGK